RDRRLHTRRQEGCRQLYRRGESGAGCGREGDRGRAGRWEGRTIMTRTQMPEKAFPVSWDQFHRDARALAWRLSGAGPFDAIVTVTRGGLVPAAIVARELNVRLIETICISSYDHIRQGDLKVLKGVASELVQKGGGRGVLIVDDLVDTGKT